LLPDYSKHSTDSRKIPQPFQGLQNNSDTANMYCNIVTVEGNTTTGTLNSLAHRTSIVSLATKQHVYSSINEAIFTMSTSKTENLPKVNEY